MKLSPEEKRIVAIGTRIAAFAILIAFLLYNLPMLWGALGTLVNILKPFLFGLGMAFLVNVPMRRIESLVSRLPIGKMAARAVSMLLAYALIVAFVIFTFAIVIPQVVDSIQKFIPLLPNALRSMRDWIANATWLATYRVSILDAINGLINNINVMTPQEFLDTYFQGVNLQTLLSDLATNVFTQVSTFFSVVVSVLVALIFSLYALTSKDKLSRQAKKLVYTFLPEKNADTVMYVGYTAYDNFYNFFTGQFLEALLLALMNYVGMTILGLDYSLVVSLLTLLGALVPLVGALIAGLVGALMLLTISPVQAIGYLCYVTVLQQLEGNIVYPRVVGSRTGLPGMWVLLAVLVGAALLGFIGMFIFVPLFATVYTILTDYTERRLAEKNIRLESK